MGKVFKIIGIIISILALIFVLFVGIITITDYKPKDVISLNVENNSAIKVKRNIPLSIVTFNIGYCGMDKNIDFFMDGGTGSRSKSKEQTLINLDKITKFIKEQNSSFVFIQEIDWNASRSYHINEYEYMTKRMGKYGSVFGTNYRVLWVPVPVTHPMGYVNGGLAVFSKYKIDTSSRYQYPGDEKWPRQLFELDRCFIETRIPVDNGKELILINSHLSAFDKGGEIRKQQLNFLKKHIEEEYAKGNYIIVGGDWNHVLPGTNPTTFKATEEWPYWLQELPKDFIPQGFSWGVDKSTPTNRTVASAYKKGENFTSIIDGFLVSNNIKIKNITTHQLEFENADHNPVTGIFILK